MNYKILKQAVHAIGDDCDGAITQDGMGFNKGDADKYSQIWGQDKWLRETAMDMYERLERYRTQLKNKGISYADIPNPKYEENPDFEEDNAIRFELSDFEKLDWSSTTYEKNNIVYHAVKAQIPYFFWDYFKDYENKQEFFSTYELDYPNQCLIKTLKIKDDSKALTIESILKDFEEVKGVLVKRGTLELKKMSMMKGFWDLKKNKTEQLKKQGISCIKDENGFWELALWKPIKKEVKNETRGTVKNSVKIFDDSSIDNSILYSYQKDHAKKIYKSLINNNYALDGSDTGTGKTFSSLVVAKAIELTHANSGIFVICPKAVIPSWEKSAKKISNNIISIVNYELIRTGKYRVEKRTISRGINKGKPKLVNVECPYFKRTTNENRRNKYDPKYFYEWNLPENTVLIFDEAHRCKNKSQNTEMMKAAKNANVKILMLSATIGESPLKMVGSGKVLDFYNEDWEFYTEFIPKYGCSKNRFGWEFNDWSGKHMKKLHNEIYGKGKGSRMDVKTLIEQGLFPETQILFEAYNMNGETAKINKAYTDMYKALAKLQESQECMTTPLVIRQKARQIAELAKCKMLTEMTRDLIEEGYSIALFVNYTETLEQLSKQLKTDCLICGGNKNNENNRLAFQANKENIIICNIKAAKEGIDLHDEHGTNPRISLIIPDDSAQDIQQVLGRIHRSGGTYSQQRIIFAVDTIETQVMKNAQHKILNIKTLNDGNIDDSIWDSLNL